mmetsp:Transcript_49540/g.111403  ORF Transcript_49540/g.111403 Transcript_49540/m.111403 type:complete len:80 (+) Transcript_49540:710-949(+)
MSVAPWAEYRTGGACSAEKLDVVCLGNIQRRDRLAGVPPADCSRCLACSRAGLPVRGAKEAAAPTVIIKRCCCTLQSRG